MEDPIVHLTNGVPDSGTGNITTLGMTLTDGANATFGATTDAVVNAGAAGSLSAKLRAISRDIVSNIVLAAGSNLIGIFKVGDGTNTAAIKPANTAAVAGDPALVVTISPNGINQDGRRTPNNSAPVVLASQTYQSVAAGASAVVLGTTGAVGDWVDFLLVIPANTSPGAVSLTDGAGSAITLFPGGASSVASTVPFAVPIRAISGSGAWKVTTGTGVSVLAVGNFT